jgi:hypothetical protein
LRPWTIEDAKDGDVLVASDNSIFILKSVVNNDCVCYVALSTDNSITLEDYWEVATAVHPATKEQHDLLFQKMKETGYEWDAEKKELKKIEHKHPDMVANLKEYIANTPKEQLEKDWDELKHWNNVGPTIEEFLYGKQNPAWSEEDEKRVVELKTFIANCNGFNKANRQKAFDLIDALHPQTQWKPSDEQMETLQFAHNRIVIMHDSHAENDASIIRSLIDDLKKLKG